MGNDAASLAFNKNKDDDFNQTPSGFLSSQDIADAVVATLSFGPNVEVKKYFMGISDYNATSISSLVQYDN